MIFYLTFNDLPSGIYSSQVIDVITFIRTNMQAPVKLIAFISIRGFYNNRKKIKIELKDAVVVPMFPGVQRWRYNAVLLRILCLIFQPRSIIGRSVIATQLAFMTGVKKIIYDGRGAIAAEWKEYGVINHSKMLSEISVLEKDCVLRSSYRIAVSEKLVEWWKKEYGYKESLHVVIPCTLNKAFKNLNLDENSLLVKRTNLGFKQNERIIIYAGSIAGWQSFELIYNFIKPLLKNNNNIKLFFLSDEDQNISKLKKEFPDKILCRKVQPLEVPSYLITGDYSLLIREETVTNQVASPVKFAEYLACGLPVIISNNLGDYTDFVKKNECGYLLNTFNISDIKIMDKEKIGQLAMNNFLKEKFTDSYKKVIDASFDET